MAAAGIISHLIGVVRHLERVALAAAVASTASRGLEQLLHEGHRVGRQAVRLSTVLNPLSRLPEYALLDERLPLAGDYVVFEVGLLVSQDVELLLEAEHVQDADKVLAMIPLHPSSARLRHCSLPRRAARR